MKSATKPTTTKEILRKWHLFDVKGKILGRAGVAIAHLLMGKSKPYFVRNLDCGDYVVVINAKDIAVTGKKLTEKIYYRHSGYPSGLKGKALKDVLASRPEEVIRSAVSGMLPQNKLKATMIKRLKIFAGEDTKYTDKFVK